jgi:hypothetical protein
MQSDQQNQTLNQSDEDEIQPCLTNGGKTHFSMDEAFCARMLEAIGAGLENPPIGVVTTPGTNNPKYFAAEPWPLASSLGDIDR